MTCRLGRVILSIWGYFNHAVAKDPGTTIARFTPDTVDYAVEWIKRRYVPGLLRSLTNILSTESNAGVTPYQSDERHRMILMISSSKIVQDIFWSPILTSQNRSCSSQDHPYTATWWWYFLQLIISCCPLAGGRYLQTLHSAPLSSHRPISIWSWTLTKDRQLWHKADTLFFISSRVALKQHKQSGFHDLTLPVYELWFRCGFCFSSSSK